MYVHEPSKIPQFIPYWSINLEKIEGIIDASKTAKIAFCSVVMTQFYVMLSLKRRKV